MTDQNHSSPHEPAEYRDRQLAGIFRADPVPDHDASFWAALEADLGQTTTSIAEGVAVITLDQERAERRRPWALQAVLAAAAVLLVAAIGAITWTAGSEAPPASDNNGSIASDDGPAQDVTSTIDDGEGSGGSQGDEAVDPAPTQPPSVESPFPVIDYSKPGRVDLLGTGSAIGTTPDGQAILVLDENREKPDLGCEAVPLLALYAQDIATGRRRAVLPPGMVVETGGLEFLFAGYDRPLTGEPTEVYWSDYCDGERNGSWRATMAPDGMITDPVDMADSTDDPFAGGATTAAIARGEVSTDGRYRLRSDERSVTVESLDRAAGERWVYDEAVKSGWGARFAPAGDVVVFNNSGQTTFWRYRTGETWVVATSENTGANFGRSGHYVFLNHFDPLPRFGLLDFGEGPAPAPASTGAPCSGTADLGPLNASGLPAPIVDVVTAIDGAAAVCDWPRLAALAGDGFQLGFGGGDPLTSWAETEAGGGTPMLDLRMLLRQPFTRNDAGDEPIYSWPEVFGKGCDAITDADRTSLAALGYDGTQLAADCEAFGGYAGLRTGITDTGRWLYLVAGD